MKGVKAGFPRKNVVNLHLKRPGRPEPVLQGSNVVFQSCLKVKSKIYSNLPHEKSREQN